MALKDLLKKAFKKEEAKPANAVRPAVEVKDDEISIIAKSLDSVVEASGKELTPDEIVDLREKALEIPGLVEELIDKVFERLLTRELAALDEQIERDQEEAIVIGPAAEVTDIIEEIKAARLSAEEIEKAYTEKEIVSAGDSLGAEVNINNKKKENAEILHKAIFGGR